MWKKACNGEIISLFQMDSPVGEQAMISIQPDTLLELATLNSVNTMAAHDSNVMMKIS
jgi:DNA polymerase III alpha subunit